jgi:hypothetical protein
MNQQQKASILGIFRGECGGDTNEPSAHTPQTIDSGDMEAAPAAGEQTATREEAFRALMEGEYKDLFTAYFQETFNRRFKEHKTLKAELEESRAVIDAVKECFGNTDSNTLLTAIRAETDRKNALTERGQEQVEPPAVKETAPDPEEIRILARRELLASIRARGMRPAESALASPVSITHGEARLNREEREALARRAARGEQILL